MVDSTGAAHYDPYHWNYQGLHHMGGKMSALTSKILGLTN
jgi:hypothetical protein